MKLISLVVYGSTIQSISMLLLITFRSNTKDVRLVRLVRYVLYKFSVVMFSIVAIKLSEFSKYISIVAGVSDSFNVLAYTVMSFVLSNSCSKVARTYSFSFIFSDQIPSCSFVSLYILEM